MLNNQRKRQSGSGGAAARSGRSQEYLFPQCYSQPAEKVVTAEVPNNLRKRWSGSGGAGEQSERGQEYLFPRRYSHPAGKVVKAEVPNNQ